MSRLPHAACRLLTLLGALALPAAAQSVLADGQVAVVTSDGLYLAGPVGVSLRLLGAADFGRQVLVQPSVTWLDDSDSFLVTTRAGAEPTGLFRVALHAGPVASVDELPVPAGLGASWTDADYIASLRELRLLDHAGARVFAWSDPLQHPVGVAPQLVLLHATLDEPCSLSVQGVELPGGVLVCQRHEIQRLSDVTTPETLWAYAGPGWLQGFSDVAARSDVSFEWFAAERASDFFGVVFPSGVASNFNQWGLGCEDPVLGPSDIEWDASKRRLVVVAADGLDCAAGGAYVDEPNHVLRFRTVLPLIDPPLPVILTPVPDSGIDGDDPDLALVRFDEPSIDHVGSATPATSGQAPTSLVGGLLAVDGQVQTLLEDAPPGAPAWLIIGLQAAPHVMAGQLAWPSPDFVVPFVTDGLGAAGALWELPNDPTVQGSEVWIQWWVQDGPQLIASWATVLAFGA